MKSSCNRRVILISVLYLLSALTIAYFPMCQGFFVFITTINCNQELPTNTIIAHNKQLPQQNLIGTPSYVSKDFLAQDRENQFKIVENGCSFMPLQRYYAKNLHRNIGLNYNDMAKLIPNLEVVQEDLLKYNLSKSTLSLLEQYTKGDIIHGNNRHNPKKMTQDDLLNKIRAEYRAAQPLCRDDILQILYCDAHICVVNKPSGVLSVPGPRRNPSVANLVYDTIQPKDIENVDQTVVHRLDMATSGIVVYALSLQALSKLHADFKDRNVHKTYHALVEGHLFCNNINTSTDQALHSSPLSVNDGEIEVDLERDPNRPPFMRIAKPRNSRPMTHKFWREAPKPSLTTFSILGREYQHGQPVTRLALRPWTGRTHQLRVHTAQVLGTPIVGDDIYGRKQDEKDSSGRYFLASSSLCLHAQKLCIRHPISGAPMIFEADPPF